MLLFIINHCSCSPASTAPGSFRFAGVCLGQKHQPALCGDIHSRKLSVAPPPPKSTFFPFIFFCFHSSHVTVSDFIVFSLSLVCSAFNGLVTVELQNAAVIKHSNLQPEKHTASFFRVRLRQVRHLLSKLSCKPTFIACIIRHT
jgi:hypothetical protein